MTALALLSSFIIFPSTGLEHKSSYRVVPCQGICSIGEIRGVYIVIQYITFHIFFVTRQHKYIRAKLLIITSYNKPMFLRAAMLNTYQTQNNNMF